MYNFLFSKWPPLRLSLWVSRTDYSVLRVLHIATHLNPFRRWLKHGQCKGITGYYLPCITRYYRVFQGIPRYDWVLLNITALLDAEKYYLVLQQDITRYCTVLNGIAIHLNTFRRWFRQGHYKGVIFYNRVLPCITGYYRVLPGCNRVLMPNIGCNRVVLGIVCRVLLKYKAPSARTETRWTSTLRKESGDFQDWASLPTRRI